MPKFEVFYSLILDAFNERDASDLARDKLANDDPGFFVSLLSLSHVQEADHDDLRLLEGGNA